MEELDERSFLFRVQVHPNGRGLGGIAYHKFHQLGLNGGLEGGIRVRNMLLRCRRLRGIDLALDLLELFSVEDSFCKGCFSNLAVPCLCNAFGYGDDTIWS